MGITSSVGISSGIDYESMISQLRSANSQPIYLAQRNQSTIQTKQSALQSINKMLAQFKSAAEELNDRDSFLNMTATSSNSKLATASASSKAKTGSYSVKVNQLAQAHRIASQGVESTGGTPIASGAGTFQYKVGDGATVSLDVTAGTTLQDLVDAINNADGSRVSASIVNDGTASNPYRLVLTAKDTGADNAITIVNNDTVLNLSGTSIEAAHATQGNQFDGTITSSGTYTGSDNKNVLIEITSAGAVGAAKYKVSYDGGLTWSADDAFTTSALAVDVTGAEAEGIMVQFAAGTANFAAGDRFGIDAFTPELQQAQNALMTVDGIQVSRATNTFEDAIDGVTLTAKAVDTEKVTISIANGNSGVTSKVQAFIDAYNDLVDEVGKQTAYDTENQSASALFGDSGVTGLLATLRGEMTSVMSGIGSINSLSQIGIGMDASGHLAMDSTEFGDALKNNLDQVLKLFVESGASSNSGIEFSKSTDATKPGKYAINITTAAEQASIVGAMTVGAGGLTAAEIVTVSLNGSAVSVALQAGQTIGSIVDTLNQSFADKGLDILASSEGGKLKINSVEYGSEQELSIFSNKAADAAGQLGIGTTSIKDTGVDVAGTINGLTGKGTGQTLKGLAGTDTEGLEMKIVATMAVSGTLTLSQGSALRVLRQIEGYTDTKTGLFATRDESYTAQLKVYDERIEALQDRLDSEETRLRKQFTALESKLATMQSQGNYLLSQLSSLIGTS